MDAAVSREQVNRGVDETLHPARGVEFWLPLVVGVVGAAVVAARTQVPSFWWDEAATVSMADRSLLGVLRALSDVDAVHGLYYLFMHFWFDVFGISEFSARAPSAIAVGVGAAAVAKIATMLRGSTAGVCAGAVFVVLPRMTWAGAEARSYAMVAAAAAVWTLILMLAIRSGSRFLWVLYAVATAACIGLFLYSATLVAAHAATTSMFARRYMRSQLIAAATGVVAISPLALLVWRQSEQVSWIPPIDSYIVHTVLVDQFFLENPLFAVVFAGLTVVVAGLCILRARVSMPLVAVALPWLIVPISSMLLFSVVVDNIYIDRYLIFCAPAVALMVGALVADASSSSRPVIAGVGVAIGIGVLVAASIPSYLAQRTEWHKSGGMDYSSVADYVDSAARPGDCVAFQSVVSWAPSSLRVAKDARPDAFVGLDDVGLGVSAIDSDALWDLDATVAETAQRSSRCSVVWVVADRDRNVQERYLHSANVVWVFEPSRYADSELALALSGAGFVENSRVPFDHTQVVRMVRADQTQ